MGNKQTQKQKIKDLQQKSKLLERVYNKKQKYLNLYNLPDQWKKAVLNFDQGELKMLNLAHCGLRDSDLEKIGNIDMPNLEKLWLYGNKIKAKGLEHVFRNDSSKLEFLHIERNEVGNDGMQVLARKAMKSLKAVNLKNNRIGAQGVSQWLSCRTLHLTELVLSENLLGNRGAKFLIKIDMPNLEWLALSRCGIGSEGCWNLSKGRWRNLKSLGIEFNSISFPGYGCFHNADLGHLEVLNTTSSQSKSSAVSMLCLVTIKSGKTTINPRVGNRQLNNTTKEWLAQRYYKIDSENEDSEF